MIEFQGALNKSSKAWLVAAVTTLSLVTSPAFSQAPTTPRLQGPGPTEIVSGLIIGWPDLGPGFIFDDATGAASDLVAWWSINTVGPPPLGFFYGLNDTTDVAVATGIEDISEVEDASLFIYDDWVVGPIQEGEIVLFHNTTTDFYGAFRVDRIYGPNNKESMTDVTWYFQGNGSADFSSFVFSDGFETGDISRWTP